jgi:hypothetical protein
MRHRISQLSGTALPRPDLKSSIQIIGIPHRRFYVAEKLWEPFFCYWAYRSWQLAAYRAAQRLLK